jgi:hypothetical protein
VARRFSLSRRRDKLSFGHQVEVAALSDPEQNYWLRKAEEESWSRNRLRREVRESYRQRNQEEVETASKVQGPRRKTGLVGNLAGTTSADSIAADGYKWLNLPFDIGFALVRDKEIARRTFEMSAASYPEDLADRPCSTGVSPSRSLKGCSSS